MEHDNILPRFFGVVVQDYEAKFLRYGTGTGLCGAHLSRELKGLAELEQIPWAGQAYLATLKPKSYAYKTLAPMAKRLSTRKSEYLLFMRNYKVPYTNNLAEHDLRHCKTKQKVSGCYRSWQGLVDYCKLRSLLETARKRGNSLFLTIAGLISQVIPAGL